MVGQEQILSSSKSTKTITHTPNVSAYINLKESIVDTLHLSEIHILRSCEFVSVIPIIRVVTVLGKINSTMIKPDNSLPLPRSIISNNCLIVTFSRR